MSKKTQQKQSESLNLSTLLLKPNKQGQHVQSYMVLVITANMLFNLNLNSLDTY